MKRTGLQIAADLALPLEAITETFSLLAKRGAGKTYTAMVMVEEMLGHAMPVVVVDPVGVWWGLRTSADGKSAGFPITILGGDHGDLPLESAAGGVIADLVVEEHLSMILDLSLLRKGEQDKFVTDFAERLFHRNRDPLHLVLDEADAWAPQRPMKGQERMLGAVEDLVRRGRAHGIGVTLVTQRAAVLNKNVLTQTEVLIALRTIAPQDRAAIDEWIRVHGTPEQRDELMVSLPSLPVGTCWIWSPGWLDMFRRVAIRRRKTLDSSSTPKLGRKQAAPRVLAPVDLDRLRDRMAQTIERAREADPRELRRRIAELDKKLAARASPAPVERVVEVPAISDEQLRRLEKTADKLSQATVAVQDALQQIVRGLENVRGRPATSRSDTRHLRTAPPEVTQPTIPPPPRAPSESLNGGGARLRAGERRMLEVLARRHPTKLTRAQLGTLAGFTASGGTFRAYLGVLLRHGLIAERHDLIELTDAGLDQAGAVRSEPQTPGEVLDMWRSVLRAGERRMLDELVSARPRSLTRHELGERTGFTAQGGTFRAYLGVLRRNGLVDVDGDEVQASETIFLE